MILYNYIIYYYNNIFYFRRQEEEAKRRQGNADGGGGGGPEGDFMSEAKDWAGELISGQTGTGRILVRNNEGSSINDVTKRDYV